MLEDAVLTRERAGAPATAPGVLACEGGSSLLSPVRREAGDLAGDVLACEGGSSLPSRRFLLATFAWTVLAWSAAVFAWSSGRDGLAISALLGGVSLGPCLTAYGSAPICARPLLRRLVLITGGLGIVAPAVLDGTGLDLEGFSLLLAGAVAGVLLAGQRACCQRPCGCAARRGGSDRSACPPSIVTKGLHAGSDAAWP